MQITHMTEILTRAPLLVNGFADKPLTITLYRSNAIIVIDQIETNPNSVPVNCNDSVIIIDQIETSPNSRVTRNSIFH
jgi:hypothetical protein